MEDNFPYARPYLSRFFADSFLLHSFDITNLLPFHLLVVPLFVTYVTPAILSLSGGAFGTFFGT